VHRSCPRCTKSCTCSHCRVGVGGKRKGQCGEDDALEAEYEQLLAKQREANGGATNSRGSSCHYCRQKKSLYVECNKSRFHRWCASCVKNGFGVDFGELLRDKDKAWPHGCPICQATCTCSLCKRRAVAKLTKGGDATLAGMLMGFSTEDKNETNAKKKMKKMKKQQQQQQQQRQRRRSPAGRPTKKAAKAKANVQSASSVSPKAATQAAAMAPVRCLPSSVPASPPQQPLPPSARGDTGECAAMDVDLDDSSKLPHLMAVASFNSIMSSQTNSQPPLPGVGSDDSANDASLLLDMLASACEPDVTETQSSSPAKDVQIAPTAFFAAAAAQSSAQAAFRDLAQSPKRTTSSVESVPDSPTESPPTTAAVSATVTSSSAVTSASGGATTDNSLDRPGPPPLRAGQGSSAPTVTDVPQHQPVPAAVSPTSTAVPAATTAEPEGSPCSSIGSDSPPFSPSLAPDGKADNGSHATSGAAGSETLLPMDELQLPGSPRSSAKFHRSGSAFGDFTSNSLTTGRDLRDDLKLTDGAGVAMTMLARTATMPSGTQNTIVSGASPRAAEVAMGFLTMNMGVMAKTAPEKEETKRSEGRCSPRAASGGGGLLQELNGVMQISPSGRTAHLGERLGPGAC